jgi:hypothetical protein
MLTAVDRHQPISTNCTTRNPRRVRTSTGPRASIACWQRGFRSPKFASGRQRPGPAPTTLGSSRPKPRSASPPVADPDLRDKACGDPPVDTAEGPAQESGAASWGIRSLRHPTGFNAACCFPLPSQQIILRAFRPNPHRGQSLLAHHPSTQGQKAYGGKDHRLTTGCGSVFVATKMAHRSLSTNHLFLL